MSILLDAVSRSKQQQQADFDPVVAPRPLYSQTDKPKVAKALLLPAVLALAVAAAFGVNQWVVPALVAEPQAQVNAGHFPSATVTQVNTQAPAQPGNAASAPSQTATSGELAVGVRLAGKVALPPAVSNTPPVVSDNSAAMAETIVTDELSYEVAIESPEAQAAKMQALMAAGVTEQQQRAFAEVMQLETGQDAQELERRAAEQAALASKPFRTLTPEGQPSRIPEPAAGLNALQREFDKAAADMGLHRQEPRAEARNQSGTEPRNSPANNSSAHNSKLSGDALVSAFEAALKEVEFDNAAKRDVTPQPLSPIPKNSDFPRYGDLPATLQLQVPEFNIVAHVYSNNPLDRWLNVDGAELQEGDNIKGKLKIVEIRPRDVVLAVDGTSFKVPAL